MVSVSSDQHGNAQNLKTLLVQGQNTLQPEYSWPDKLCENFTK